MRRAAPLMMIAAALTFAACGGEEESTDSSSTAAAPAATATAAGDTVTIKAFQFGPDPITVKAGTTVKWVNEDATIHDVTAGDKSFASDLEKSGGTFEHTFDKAGTYSYVCTRHSGPGMKGEVVVE